MHIVKREDQELRERETLSADAACAGETEGRVASGAPDFLRTEYQRDRDKIIHSKSFRRLSHKTQVFLAVEGDHYRTRLTHTLEVAQIARTIARALALNEDLAEAIALGHDLGHTPFGHTGEAALRECIGKYRGIDSEDERFEGLFHHNEHSLRVVEAIENQGKGLNLTAEVRDGIVHHTGCVRAETMEGRIVATADRIAYVNHDTDDAIRAGLLRESDLPQHVRIVLGEDHSSRIEALVVDMVQTSAACGDIMLSRDVWAAMSELRAFLFNRVYLAEPVVHEVRKAKHLVAELFDYFMEHQEDVPHEYRSLTPDNSVRAVTDYIAGMTDRYAKTTYEDIFMPRSWR